MATHKDIRIPFTVDDRNYEAVGFLNKREHSVSGDNMLARTAKKNGGGAIGEEDECHINERRRLLPATLRGYCLATDRRPSSDPRCVSYFVWRGFRWCQSLGDLDRQWGEDILVVRRRA